MAQTTSLLGFIFITVIVMVQAEDICKLPQEVGPCKASFSRFYFDKVAGKCQDFTYGGCGGNENNFETKEACQAKCICQQPQEVGPCFAAMERFYFDKDQGKCKTFTYGGCGGNENNFETEGACQEMCICQQPQEVGPCFAAMERFYFDKDDGKCRKFEYGGCMGNANNFQKEKGCRAKTSECRGICELPKEVGPCKAAHLRYYFDNDDGKCKEFTYGGCDGNANNFEKVEACQAKCDICKLPQKTGPCKAAFQRYYFDNDDEKCKEFTYGGCMGNANNFETKKECRAKTSECRDICKLPKEVGPCKAAFQRYYFDNHDGKCKEFIYGGCKGNKNNFENMEACQAKCGK